jgi:hypothetical protein
MKYRFPLTCLSLVDTPAKELGLVNGLGRLVVLLTITSEFVVSLVGGYTGEMNLELKTLC